MKDVGTKLMAAIGCFALIPVLIVFGGWALAKTWGWTAVPIFGLPALTTAQGVGLASLSFFFKSQNPRAKKDDESEIGHMVQVLAGSVIATLIAMAVAWMSK